MKNKQIIQLYDLIRNYLINKGTDYFETQENIAQLDAYLVVEVINELIGSKSPQEIEKIRNYAATQPTPEQICLFMGLDLNEFEKRHLLKLQTIVNRIPQVK